jgi:hypothetical protein
VWLDDIERYLGAQGLTVPLLQRVLEADAVVLGTIRVAELDRFGARYEAGLDGDERDGWRTAREVLPLAVEIPLSRRRSDVNLSGRAGPRIVGSGPHCA